MHVMNVNELKMAFDEAGAKVQELEDKRADLILDLKKDADSHSVDELKAVKDELSKAVVVRDAAEEAYADARAEQVANMKAEDREPLTADEKTLKNKFVSDFKDMVTGVKVFNKVDSTVDTSGSAAGLTIPEDVQTTIHALVRQYDALQNYVNVENVGTANRFPCLRKVV